MNTLLGRPNDRVGVSPSRRPDSGVKPLVLVVEDHDDTRFMLEYLLGMHGCQVVIAEDGEDAVRVAERMCPDLILMDATLPRLDGLAATRRIRELATLNDVPIVFLSGHAQPAFRAEALSTGCNDYIVKPFAVDQLEGVLERHLGGIGRSRQI
jgi:two-component system cell cycle response regulator DivK